MILKGKWQLAGFRPRADKSVSITLVSSFEATPKDMGLLTELHQMEGEMAFKPNGLLTPQEMKGLDAVDGDFKDTRKTNSQRLRNVLFVLWKSEQSEPNFDDFYKSKMEQIIEHFKSKLPPNA